MNKLRDVLTGPLYLSWLQSIHLCTCVGRLFDKRPVVQGVRKTFGVVRKKRMRSGNRRSEDEEGVTRKRDVVNMEQMGYEGLFADP